jgi:transcriptional regulator with XRE-family HTH domain
MINKASILLKLAAHITKLRKAKKMSIHGLAQSAGIEYALMQRIEKGKVNLQFTTLVKISKGLDIHLDDMIDGLKYAE